MANLASILNQRFLKKDKTKTTELAERSNTGSLSSFAGIFGVNKMGEGERANLALLLTRYAQNEKTDISEDLDSLAAITSEVRAINNQAALLHGERIKKAQEILKKYRDGAFSTWLLTTYGNRQTPYNFLQYFEFFYKLPPKLHPQIETMPRQAIYTLASREGSLDQKVEIVRNYKGETKQQLLTLIRTYFPLDEHDKRKEDLATGALLALKRLETSFEGRSVRLKKGQKEALLKAISALRAKVNAL